MNDGETPLVRTSFSSESAWEALQVEIAQENEMGFRAYIYPVSDPRFNACKTIDIETAFEDAMIVFVADERALTAGEVLCLDTEDPAKTFRVKTKDLWLVENNISVGNLLFEELLNQVDKDGVLKMGSD